MKMEATARRGHAPLLVDAIEVWNRDVVGPLAGTSTAQLSFRRHGSGAPRRTPAKWVRFARLLRGRRGQRRVRQPDDRLTRSALSSTRITSTLANETLHLL